MTQDERARLLDEGDKRAMGLGLKFARYFKAAGWVWERESGSSYLPTAGDVRRLIRRHLDYLRTHPGCEQISSGGITAELSSEADALFIRFEDEDEVSLPGRAA